MKIGKLKNGKFGDWKFETVKFIIGISKKLGNWKFESLKTKYVKTCKLKQLVFIWEISGTSLFSKFCEDGDREMKKTD